MLGIISKIPGLGTIGASGVLALAHPENYGTIDRWVLESFHVNGEFRYVRSLDLDYKASYGLEYGALLTLRLREIAQQLNEKNRVNSWTPRRVDMVLFAARGE
jgi:hypothetical protein